MESPGRFKFPDAGTERRAVAALGFRDVTQSLTATALPFSIGQGSVTGLACVPSLCLPFRTLQLC